MLRERKSQEKWYADHDKSGVTLTPVDATRFGSKLGVFEFLLDDEERVSAVKQGPTWVFKRV